MLRAAFALVALCLGLSFVAAQPPKPAVTMDDIKKAWQERQDKVKTLKMSWKRVVVKPKGSLDFVVNRFEDSGATVPQPPRDVRLQGETDFVLDGERFRYDCRRETWWIPSQTARPHRNTAIFDGKDYLTSGSSVADPAKEQTAVQSPSQASVYIESLELYPVWWCIRGAKGVLGADALSKYDTNGRTIIQNGVPCVLLESTSRSSSSSTQLTLSISGYLPVSFTHSLNGKPVTQLSIEYDKANAICLLPSKWRYVSRLPSGVTIESFEATVVSSEVGASVPVSRFQLTSPPGTLIVDTRPSDEARGSERVGVVLPDGTASETMDRRSVKSYEELVAVAQPRSPLRPWIVAAVCAIVVGALGYVLLTRRRSPV